MSTTSATATHKPKTVALTGLAGVPVPAQVVEIGRGRPMIFLHGLVGVNEHWEEVAKRIGDVSRCLLLQLPLLDLKDKDCSIDGATALTAMFLREHVREPAVIVGNSFGGHVALKLAIEQPHLVRGLVLAGASGLIEKSIVSDVQIRPNLEWVERRIGELFHDRSKMLQSDVVRAHEVLSQRPQAKAMVKLSKSARRNHLGGEIHRISCPTLVLWGREDIVTPPEACEQFQRDIRGSRVVWIDRCGHVPMIECPEPFAVAVREFLDSIEAPAAD